MQRRVAVVDRRLDPLSDDHDPRGLSLAHKARPQSSTSQSFLLVVCAGLLSVGALLCWSYWSYYNSNTIHVALTVDPAYSAGMVALMNSSMVNLKGRNRIQWHVLFQSHSAQQQIERRVRQELPRAKFHSHVLETRQLLRQVAVWDHSRTAVLSKPIVYARYFFASQFPTLNRVIYLDQDLLVVGDLAELWNVDMQGYPVAATRSCDKQSLFSSQFVMDHPALSGYDPDECTFNNGVLLYDLEQWRQNNFAQTLVRWTERNNKQKWANPAYATNAEFIFCHRFYRLGSQPPFNLAFYRNYKLLPERFNLLGISSWAPDASSRQQLPSTRLREEIESAVVLHWNGPVKPWMCSSKGPNYSALWHSYHPTLGQRFPDEEAPPECSEGVWTSEQALSKDVARITVLLGQPNVDWPSPASVVDHLLKSDLVAEVVVYEEPAKKCPYTSPRVRCTRIKDLNDPQLADSIQTAAVLLYQANTLLDLKQLEAAYKIWHNQPAAVLGFQSSRTEPAAKAAIQVSGDAATLQAELASVVDEAFFVNRSLVGQASSARIFLGEADHPSCYFASLYRRYVQISKKPPTLWRFIGQAQKCLFQEGDDTECSPINTSAWLQALRKCPTHIEETHIDDDDDSRPVRFEYLHTSNRIVSYRI